MLLELYSNAKKLIYFTYLELNKVQCHYHIQEMLQSLVELSEIIIRMKNVKLYSELNGECCIACLEHFARVYQL